MKGLGYILAVLSLLAALLYIAYRNISSRVKFDVGFQNLDFSNVNLMNLASNTAKINFKSLLTVQNWNNIGFTVDIRNIDVFYKGKLLAFNVANEILHIPKDAESIHEIPTIMLLSKAEINLIQDILSGKPLVFDYTISYEIFKIPLTSKDSFTITKY